MLHVEGGTEEGVVGGGGGSLELGVAGFKGLGAGRDEIYRGEGGVLTGSFLVCLVFGGGVLLGVLLPSALLLVCRTS